MNVTGKDTFGHKMLLYQKPSKIFCLKFKLEQDLLIKLTENQTFCFLSSFWGKKNLVNYRIHFEF